MFDEKDLLLHKALIKILDEGTFQLKAREVRAFDVVYNWIKNLPEVKKQIKPEVKKSK